jgi:hypothetical protein
MISPARNNPYPVCPDAPRRPQRVSRVGGGALGAVARSLDFTHIVVAPRMGLDGNPMFVVGAPVVRATRLAAAVEE